MREYPRLKSFILFPFFRQKESNKKRNIPTRMAFNLSFDGPFEVQNSGPTMSFDNEFTINDTNFSLDISNPFNNGGFNSEIIHDGSSHMIFQDAKLQALLAEAPSGQGVNLDHKEQILLRPDTVLGSVIPAPRIGWLYDFNERRMIKQQHHVPCGQERIYLEILLNTADNADRTVKYNSLRILPDQIPLGKLEITVTPTIIKIRNGGHPINLARHFQMYDKYNPEVIFGMLLSSTNYDDRVERTGGGKNGYGAKAANIFSEVFTISLGNHLEQKSYQQTWRNNMSDVEAPIINDYHGESFTEITYYTDFKRFGQTENTLQFMMLCARHAFDISFTTKLPVFFNGVELKGSKVDDFTAAYFGKGVKKITHYEWPPGTKLVEKKKRSGVVMVPENPNIVPIIEMCIVDSPENGENFGYVNGINTWNGGVHIDAAMKVLSDHVLPFINNGMRTMSKAKTTKGKAKKEPAERKKPSFTLTPSDFKPHITLIMNCRFINPVFDAQTKTKCEAPKPSIKIKEEQLSTMLNWELINRLRRILEMKRIMARQKMDGKNRDYVDLDKLEDANDAGKAGRFDCYLWLCEGDSAKKMVMGLVDYMPGGKNKNGVYPLRGKFLNVMKATPKQIDKSNQEGIIGQLKSALGLCEMMDYLNENNYRTLRYGGGIQIAADSDIDGKHILGLTLNFFGQFAPTLITRGYINYPRTPITSLTAGREIRLFYTEGEYRNFLEQNPGAKKWHKKHYKGLGSWSDKEIVKHHKQFRYVQCVTDENSRHAFEMAFKNINADNRKLWIERVTDPAMLPHRWAVESMHPQQPTSLFIEYEMGQYAAGVLPRAIPAEIDGLKDVERKILDTAFKRYGYKITSRSHAVKVGVFAGAVTDLTEYEHGETSIHAAMCAMTQGFVGTNNILYFTPESQFGSRDTGSLPNKGCAQPRYIFVKPNPLLPYIFLKADEPILTFKYEGKKQLEPLFYLPIIPLHMANGAVGIATGYSTYIPQFNPIDIYYCLRALILGYQMPSLIPWFRGFTGKVYIKENLPKANKKSKKAQPVKREAYVDPNNPNVVETPSMSFDNFMTDNDNDEEGDRESETDELPEQADPDKDMKTDKFDVSNSKYCLVTEGCFTQKGDTIHITELPVGRWTDVYLTWLRTLKKDKLIKEKPQNNSKTIAGKIDITIRGWNPKISDEQKKKAEEKKANKKKPLTLNNEFEFFVETQPKKEKRNPMDATIKDLRLRKTFGLGNMRLLNFNGTPIKHETPYTMIQSFFNIRLPFYAQRKDLILKTMNETLQVHQERIRLINAILNRQIIIMEEGNSGRRVPIARIQPVLIQMGFTVKLYRTLKVEELSEEKVHFLEKKIADLQEKVHRLTNLAPSQLWLNDLNKFIKAYAREYKEKLPADLLATIEQEEKQLNFSIEAISDENDEEANAEDNEEEGLPDDADEGLTYNFEDGTIIVDADVTPTNTNIEINF
jgi:DNA gyrase/topoisomerase IV subunit B